jgi:hypothetical protein
MWLLKRDSYSYSNGYGNGDGHGHGTGNGYGNGYGNGDGNGRSNEGPKPDHLLLLAALQGGHCVVT